MQVLHVNTETIEHFHAKHDPSERDAQMCKLLFYIIDLWYRNTVMLAH